MNDKYFIESIHKKYAALLEEMDVLLDIIKGGDLEYACGECEFRFEDYCFLFSRKLSVQDDDDCRLKECVDIESIINKIKELQIHLSDKADRKCEYSPILKRASYTYESHARIDAVWAIGSRPWYLCDSCARLPEFRRFPKRVWIGPQEVSDE